MNDFLSKHTRSDEAAMPVKEEPPLNGGQMTASDDVKALPDSEILVDQVKSENSGYEEVTIEVELPENTDDVDPLAADPTEWPYERQLVTSYAPLLYSHLQTCFSAPNPLAEETPNLLSHVFPEDNVARYRGGEPTGQPGSGGKSLSRESSCGTSKVESLEEHYLDPTSSYIFDSPDEIFDVYENAVQDCDIEENGRILREVLRGKGVKRKEDYDSVSSPEIVDKEPETIVIDDDSDEENNDIKSDYDNRGDDSEIESSEEIQSNRVWRSSQSVASSSRTDTADESEHFVDASDSEVLESISRAGPSHVSSGIAKGRPSGNKRANNLANDNIELTAQFERADPRRKRRTKKARLLEIYEKILDQLQELEGVPTDTSSSDEDSGVEEKDQVETGFSIHLGGGQRSMDDALKIAALANRIAGHDALKRDSRREKSALKRLSGKYPHKSAVDPKNWLISMKSKLEKRLHPPVLLSLSSESKESY